MKLLVVAIVAAFIAGAFIASPELRAYAANTVGSADIINNSILSEDIKDGEVKTADIASGAVQNSDIATNAVTALKIQEDAVGASEIKGVTKLIFAKLTVGGMVIDPQESSTFGTINIAGVAAGDNVIVTSSNWINKDIEVIGAAIDTDNTVVITIKNDGDSTITVPTFTYSLIIYKIG